MPDITLDTDDAIDLTVSQARELIGAIDAADHKGDYSDLTSGLDKAQGEVMQGSSDVQYIVIRVSP